MLLFVVAAERTDSEAACWYDRWGYEHTNIPSTWTRTTGGKTGDRQRAGTQKPYSHNCHIKQWFLYKCNSAKSSQHIRHKCGFFKFIWNVWIESFKHNENITNYRSTSCNRNMYIIVIKYKKYSSRKPLIFDTQFIIIIKTVLYLVAA